jgi:hypothetical protein
MKTTVRKYAAEQGLAEETALMKGLEEKSKKFVKRRGDLRKSVKISMI